MAGTSRIDELRKKFDENPRRYFAPLANEYRKIGDFDQAIFICQEFLPQQPGHMSGHIVYGQALFESGRHDEARSVFETALALDPENLIALRHLGDIARAQGDNETARAWYHRVLESDPRNEEIAAILNSLDSGSTAQPEMTSPAESHAESSSGSGEPISVESAISAATSGQAEAPVAESADPIVSDPLTSAPPESSFDDIAKLFTSHSASAAASDESPPAALEGHDVHDAHPSDTDFVSQIEKEEPPLGEPGSVVVPAENTPTSFDLPFLEGLTAPAADASSPPPPPPREPEETPRPVADASTAFVTETMAELYVRQGHHDQAIDVYRQLIQRHPDDTALAARLRELESARGGAGEEAPPNEAAREAVAEAGPTIREFLGSIAQFRPRSGDVEAPITPTIDEAPAADAVVEHNEAPRAERGQSLAGSLDHLFSGAEGRVPAADAARPAADVAPASSAKEGEAESPPIHGRPSSPAATEISLDYVFRHATPASGNAGQSSFSFDQFFSQQAQQDVAAADAETSSEDSAGLSDDIQQFNAWLEGLKKT